MNIADFDMDSISSLLSSMSKEDMDALKGLADSVLSSSGGEKENEKEEKESDENTGGGFPDFDMETMAKIASVMKMLNSNKSDPRIDLINALEPLLQGEHKQRAKQAVQMLRLISILPLIKDIG